MSKREHARVREKVQERMFIFVCLHALCECVFKLLARLYVHTLEYTATHIEREVALCKRMHDDENRRGTLGFHSRFGRLANMAPYTCECRRLCLAVSNEARAEATMLGCAILGIMLDCGLYGFVCCSVGV